MRYALLAACLLYSANALAATAQCPYARSKYTYNSGSVATRPPVTYTIMTVPADRKILDASPPVISVVLAEKLPSTKGFIHVYDLFGTEVAGGPVTADRRTLSLPIAALKPGKYSVKWRASCACDAHTDLNGHFHFTVK